MKIGLLVAGILPPTLTEIYARYGNMYEDLLQDRSFTFRHYDVRNGELPCSADEADGWIITGSKDGVYDDLPWIADLKVSVDGLLNANAPIVGICFGHQLLAEVRGGRVEKFSGGWSVGRTAYTLTSGQQMHAMAWHQDQVVDLPPDAIRLGQSDMCENAMMLISGHALGIQPHPEFTANIVKNAVKASTFLPAAIREEAVKTAAEPVARLAQADVIEAFFKAETRDPETLRALILDIFAEKEAA
ncbi:type 1 glutamine amidotransferase [Parasedimentitalea maritima]|uniref:Type 1 glutamine amidotransferase n=1 Tax=Parasedimentitalea maritima TaxID=2578117 RepID=A0A6A4R7M2_9RHOB|nr:type 1 glutamine amidotransferase [Zongyanglinia marina]KAE9627217.1 type 1 glutamine amidotransferase [Zongyanglinia marina]